MVSRPAGAVNRLPDYVELRRRVVEFLHRQGADAVPHLRGTLTEHLEGTEGLLRAWGSSDALALAGLCHATYGTDGFAPSLLSLGKRAVLRDLVPAEVEDIVYFYASCDRKAVYPQLGNSNPVAFRDRFTDRVFEPTAAQLGQFVDLTLANEIEITLIDSAIAGPPRWLTSLFAQMQDLASPSVQRCVRQHLGDED
jgi:hypothetical protein